MDELLELRGRLLELQIITDRDWQIAMEGIKQASEAGASGPSDMTPVADDLFSVLHRMTQQRAQWLLRGDAFMPALTQFQLETIMADRTENLRLADYVILDQIGSGAMGNVFRARNLNLSRIEAVKTVLSNAPIERFRREAQALAKLKHPGLVSVYNAGCSDDIYFIAMEYIRGTNLKNYVDDMKTEGRLPEVLWVLRSTRALAEALGHAHENNIIHRDVKPSNIVLEDGRHPRLLDLGLALLFSADRSATPYLQNLTMKGRALGTPAYMPPEQWENASAATPASDIYSLGCTFFYMLTGEAPFPERDPKELAKAHALTVAPAPSLLREDLPRSVDLLVAKMLAKRLGERIGRTEEVVAEIDAIENQIVRAEHGGTPGWQMKRKERAEAATKSPLKFLVGLCGAIVGLLAFALWWTSGTTSSTVVANLKHDVVAVNDVPPDKVEEPPAKVEPVKAEPEKKKPVAKPEPVKDEPKAVKNETPVAKPEITKPEPPRDLPELPKTKPEVPKPNSLEPMIAKVQQPAGKDVPSVQRGAPKNTDELPDDVGKDADTLAQIPLPKLLRAIKHADPDVRWMAARELGEPRRDAAGAIPVLIEALSDPHSTVRRASAWSLGQWRQEAKSAAPALCKLLKDEDRYVRLFAAKALGEIGPPAAEAVKHLEEAATADDAEIRNTANEAIRKIKK